MKNQRTIFRITRWISVAALTLICLTPSTALGQGAKANFSGTWVLNEEKSNIAPSPFANIEIAMVASGSSRPIEKKVVALKNQHSLVVSQKADTIIIERIIDANNRHPDDTRTYALNGKENMLDSGLNTGIATTTFSPDGKILTIAITRTSVDNNEEIHKWKTTEVWQLSHPNTLTIVKSSSNRKGSPDTFVYEKSK